MAQASFARQRRSSVDRMTCCSFVCVGLVVRAAEFELSYSPRSEHRVGDRTPETAARGHMYRGCATPTTPPEVESKDAYTKRNIVLECESPQLMLSLNRQQSHSGRRTAFFVICKEQLLWARQKVSQLCAVGSSEYPNPQISHKYTLFCK